MDIQVAITDIVRDAFRVDRCYYGILEGDKATIQRESAREGLPSVVGVYETSKLPIFIRVVNAGRPFIVNDAKTTNLLDEESRKLCLRLQVISFIDVPVIKNGRAVGVFSIVDGQPRVWTDLEVELAEEVAGRMWAAVERREAILKMAEAGNAKLSTNFLCAHGFKSASGWSSFTAEKPILILKLENVTSIKGLKSP